MGTLDYMRHDGIIANTSEEAFDMLINKGIRSIGMYSSNSKDLRRKLAKLYKLIREKNATIEDLDEQYVAAEPYYWSDIDGCLHVDCAEVVAGKFKDMSGGISFTGWDYSVLSTN